MESKVFFQTENGEFTTDLVLQYFLYLNIQEKFSKINIERHNSDDFVTDISFIIENKYKLINYFNSKGLKFCSSSSKKYFYRRGNINFALNGLDEIKKSDELNNYANKEIEILKEVLLNRNSNIFSFSNYYEERYSNKLEQLIVASLFDFLIPKTLVTTSKADLMTFMLNYSKIIFKPISNHQTIKIDNLTYEPSGTVLFHSNMLEYLEDKFFPTLFQEYIEKQFEIRVFLFEQNIYSMAIMSQSNSKTQLDFRNYDDKLPNRFIPFKLENKYVNKIKKIFKKLNLSTGSVDLIWTTDNKLIFLEINPIGQFSWLSEECNYFIEKRIAQNFITKL